MQTLVRGATPQPAVLVVDSNEMVRARVRDWLAREFPRCRCVEAATLEEARTLASAEFPDAALVSIDIPDAMGFGILRMLRHEAPVAPVVAYSVYHTAAYHDRALRSGAAACVSIQGTDNLLKRLLGRLLEPAAC